MRYQQENPGDWGQMQGAPGITKESSSASLKRRQRNLHVTFRIGLLASSCFWLTSGIKPNSRISRNGFLGLRFTLAQQLVDDDRAKGCGTDAAKGEVANVDGEVTGTHGQGDGGCN